jgi:hypothetical protein
MEEPTPLPQCGTTLHLTDPGDLVAYVTHMFGSPPLDSLVLLFLDGPLMIMAARFNVADIIEAAPADVFTDLLWQARTHAAQRVIALVHAPRRRARRLRGLLQRGLGPWLDFWLVVDHEAGLWWEGRAQADDPGQLIPDDPRLAEWSRLHAWEKAEPFRPGRASPRALAELSRAA